ncbi:hypothetical protein OJ253_272 [Cryptosporidium canis]|uniref:Proteinase inhibitor I42 chagasin domain-containing protein n=1 Tax=Cryptosporidium canis TaxID=195482 RepID=A0A9D5HVU4_9CRYT|nr:hypothetical protein OJ253_272 [Cryptosporidium canis]
MLDTSRASVTNEDNLKSDISLDYRNSNQVTIHVGDVSNTKSIRYSITVKVGTDVTFYVKGNPTTGYSQRVTTRPESSIVKVADTEPNYIPDKHSEMIVGYGGVYVFKFLAVGIGTTTSIIEYARYFENPPKSTFKTEIRFTVVDRLDGQGLFMS